MDYSTPFNKNLWTNKFKDLADVRLFICHLMLDLQVPFFTANSFLDFVTADDKPAFTKNGAAEYEKLMETCFKINDGYYEYAVQELWPELGKWFSEDNNEVSKKINVEILSTDKLIYIAEFKSDFPIISVLYSIDTSDDEIKKKRVGYGTIMDTSVAKMDWSNLIGDFKYRLYDNETKQYFTGVLGKDEKDNFIIYFELDNSRPETLKNISK